MFKTTPRDLTLVHQNFLVIAYLIKLLEVSPHPVAVETTTLVLNCLTILGTNLSATERNDQLCKRILTAARSFSNGAHMFRKHRSQAYKLELILLHGFPEMDQENIKSIIDPFIFSYNHAKYAYQIPPMSFIAAAATIVDFIRAQLTAVFQNNINELESSRTAYAVAFIEKASASSLAHFKKMITSLKAVYSKVLLIEKPDQWMNELLSDFSGIIAYPKEYEDADPIVKRVHHEAALVLNQFVLQLSKGIVVDETDHDEISMTQIPRGCN